MPSTCAALAIALDPDSRVLSVEVPRWAEWTGADAWVGLFDQVIPERLRALGEVTARQVHDSSDEDDVVAVTVARPGGTVELLATKYRWEDHGATVFVHRVGPSDGA